MWALYFQGQINEIRQDLTECGWSYSDYEEAQSMIQNILEEITKRLR